MKKRNFKWKTPNFNSELTICDDIYAIKKEDFYNILIENQKDFEGDFQRITFTKVHFKKCKFEYSSFARCTFEDVIFEDCEFLNCDFSNSSFDIVEFITTSCRSGDFSESYLHCTLFNECDMGYSNFTKCQIDGLKTSKSIFNNTFFAECNLAEIYADETKFLNAEFFRTSLKGIDFTTCIIDGIIVSENKNELVGIIVNSVQAIDIAVMFGVVIKE